MYGVEREGQGGIQGGLRKYCIKGMNWPIWGWEGWGKIFQSGRNWPKKGHPNFSRGTATLIETMLALNLSSFSEND